MGRSRRSPHRHVVRNHRREGRPVRSYVRGRGEKQNSIRPRRVVGGGDEGPRFRMGAQMRDVLTALREYGGDFRGLTQTDIIFKVEGLMPYLETQYENTEKRIVDVDELRSLVEELRREKREILRIEPHGRDQAMVTTFSGASERTPRNISKLASALKSRKLKSRGVYGERREPYIKGTKNADKLYASYSRSIKNLLDRGFIASPKKKLSPEKFREALKERRTDYDGLKEAIERGVGLTELRSYLPAPSNVFRTRKSRRGYVITPKGENYLRGE